jgi:hypothetical protein
MGGVQVDPQGAPALQPVPVADLKADDFITSAEGAVATPLPAVDGTTFTVKDAALIPALNGIASAILALVKKR